MVKGHFRTLSTLKKGEYFRFPGKKKVYTYNGKPSRGYFNIVPHDDVWGGGRDIKKDLPVETDFDY